MALAAARPIVVAANRLPVTRSEDGWTPSPGGLVRALLPLLRDTGGTWVGWTGVADHAPAPFDLDGVHLHPVTITADEVQHYYEGFANDTLWPLYHDALRDSTYNARDWEAYQRVNERFAEAIAAVAPPDALVWVQDYHLQLVPQMLRARRPDVVIGFFMHIPFPPVELFMRLPWRSEIAAGLAACDLVGFQRQINAHNFDVVCRDLLDKSPDHRAPSRSRSTSTSCRRSRPDVRSAGSRTGCATDSVSPRSCCSASIASITRRASASGYERSSRCSTTGR